MLKQCYICQLFLSPPSCVRTIPILRTGEEWIGSGQEGCVKAIYICQQYLAFCYCPNISFSFACLALLGHFKILINCDDKTNKINVMRRMLLEIIKYREMCVFLVHNYLPQFTRPLSAPFLLRTSIS